MSSKNDAKVFDFCDLEPISTRTGCRDSERTSLRLKKNFSSFEYCRTAFLAGKERDGRLPCLGGSQPRLFGCLQPDSFLPADIFWQTACCM